ncbi:hypothetical protein TNCV_4155271 [Trichonephila clavipes]|nr:hypothetical protein TNCV_4155271 [Trichonephila clavipes]
MFLPPSPSERIVISDPDCCAENTGSNPGEGMDVCKHVKNSNISRVESSLERLLVREEGKNIGSLPPGCSLSKLRRKEPKPILICMVLMAACYDRHVPALLPR